MAGPSAAARTTRRARALSSTHRDSAASVPLSSRATSRTSSIKSAMRPARSLTMFSARPSGSSAEAAISPATGVRSSWAMFAVTSRSARRRAESASAIALTAWVRVVISSRPVSGSRAVRSPSAICSALRADCRSRLANRVARPSPITVATPVPTAPDCHMTRSTSSLRPLEGLRTARTVPLSVISAAQITSPWSVLCTWVARWPPRIFARSGPGRWGGSTFRPRVGLPCCS